MTKISSIEGGRVDIELDKTCFYHRGGGQDWDTGTATTDEAVLLVQEVRAR
ncbi:hypothetical protein IPM09_01140 [Candidatus Saccharibacteria bacterium]|nr:MAG: hypothetical protein IPM09_01140 [Candidatus Saccharibacteria bacterium]